MTVEIQDMFVDFQRCIGCMACVAACSECHTHRGRPMIHVDETDPGKSPQTTPMICMHCKVPTCAMSCPADAIKMDEQGIVHSSLKPRCIACRNCELTCPFGVPIIQEDLQQMQKCDMCFDRTSAGKRPMCSTVCPTGAIAYGNLEDMKRARPHSKPINKWRFGNQVVETRVYVMVPHNVEEMIIDWPEMLNGAKGPIDLAVKLRDRFVEMGKLPEEVPAQESAAEAGTERVSSEEPKTGTGAGAHAERFAGADGGTSHAAPGFDPTKTLPKGIKEAASAQAEFL